MKFAAKFSLVLSAAALVMLGTYGVVRSHCEIPCGIYGDQTRIALLYENITTVEKSMTQILSLQEESPANYNQLVRWVGNKEEHASQIQHIAWRYFMTQRIKPSNPKYTAQLTSMHGILVAAMKAKQTTDVEHCQQLRKLVDQFAEAYFTPEDLKHIRGHHKQ